MEAIPMEGWLDNWIKGQIKFDPSKIDHVGLKAGFRQAITAVGQGLDLPANLDELVISGACDMLDNFISNLFASNPIKVGAATFTVDNLITRYGCNERCQQILRKHPELVNYLNVLDEDQRAKVAITPILLIMLQLFGPALINWIISRFG